MNFIALSSFVGACIDCKNMHGINAKYEAKWVIRTLIDSVFWQIGLGSVYIGLPYECNLVASPF